MNNNKRKIQRYRERRDTLKKKKRNIDESRRTVQNTHTVTREGGVASVGKSLLNVFVMLSFFFFCVVFCCCNK